jgi:DMSO reductase anchor subunit
MHPAVSVICFTVLSGAGFGLIALTTALAFMPGLIALSNGEILFAGVLGTVLATLGLLASTLHLANPRNAWRAFSRFRTSWLSREAVFAVLFYPCAGLWLGAVAFDLSAVLIDLGAALSLVLSLLTVFSTGMIYASLRAIPRWNSPLVPLNYLLLGLASGALLLTTILTVTRAGAMGSDVLMLTLVLLVLAGLGKALYFLWMGTPQGPSINTALGMTRGQARLLESGQGGRSNFLDTEFRFQIDGKTLRRLRWLFGLLGVALPVVAVALLSAGDGFFLIFLILPVTLFGYGVERWLFFAEAQHVVNLFYGAQRV